MCACILYTYDRPVKVVLGLVGPVAEAPGKVAKSNARGARLKVDVVDGDVAAVGARRVARFYWYPLDHQLTPQIIGIYLLFIIALYISDKTIIITHILK